MIKQWSTDEIKRLATKGYSSYQIVEAMGDRIHISPRQVQRILKEAGLTRPRRKDRVPVVCPACGHSFA